MKTKTETETRWVVLRWLKDIKRNLYRIQPNGYVFRSEDATLFETPLAAKNAARNDERVVKVKLMTTTTIEVK